MAELIIVINRWPAVMLAVSRTPSAIGRISRLTVSIRIINGISGVGEPSGSMCASAVEGLVVIPVSTVAIHIGMARAMFIDSCEVVVKVYGKSPTRFDNIISRRRAARNRDHFWPIGDSWWIMFCRMFLMNQFIIVCSRFPISIGF